MVGLFFTMGAYVAHALLAEALLPGDNAKLWWLLPSLIGAMRRIGAPDFVGGHSESAHRLDKLLEAIRDVQWSMVDPSMTVSPSRNDFDAPMYRNGDFVHWDIDAWAPALPSCMLGAAKAQNEGRGQLYTGDLTAYSDDRLGRVTRP